MIELACITDAAYVRHTGVMLHSALARSARERISVRVLHGSPIDACDHERLERIADKFGARLRLEQIAEDRARQFPVGYFPRSVWFRVLLPELMPDANKVLYLDSDLIVTDDLSPLWETELGDHLLGAVTNPFYPFMPAHPQLNLGIAKPECYFNSGVLLMNLRQMRAESAVTRLCEFARAHPGSSYPDQDALNVVCRGRWLSLHPRWNVQSTLFELKAHELPLPPQQVSEAITNPAVIHYIGPFKPWHYLCRHARQGAYFEHARETPWGAPDLEGRSLRNAVLRRLPLVWIDRWFRLERTLAHYWQRARRRVIRRTAAF